MYLISTFYHFQGFNDDLIICNFFWIRIANMQQFAW